MQVALDVTPASCGTTGVARYTHELTRGLRALGADVRPFSVGRGRAELPSDSRRYGVPLRVMEPVWRRTGHPRAESMAGGGDVFHSIDLSIPPTRLPLVATIHDLAAIDHPELHPPIARANILRRLASLHRAAVVLTVSHAAAAGLVRHGASHPRVVVTPLAPTPLREAVVECRRRTPFILAVGEINPRKDFATLLRAIAAMTTPIDLVIAGPDGFRASEVHELIPRLRLQDRVIMLGRVSDGELAGLFRAATALCFPSIEEGFGLPLVEAMRNGLPVVASDIDIVREVTEGAALFAPVGDVEAFTVQLERVTEDASLRQELVTHGRARAAEFTWERCADLTLAAYQQARDIGNS